MSAASPPVRSERQADPVALLTHYLRTSITAAFGNETGDIDPAIRPSQNPQFGDFQANVAMALAKQLGQKPRDVAMKIVAAAPPELLDVVEPLEVAGPGFINIRLKGEYLAQVLAAFAADNRHGVPTPTDPARVVIDYSSPNVAKEMHVGHLRSTIIGDTFARVLTFMYGKQHENRVIRQNHLGDWGTQFGRVMLGLWYEAVAMKQGQISRLNEWITRAAGIPKKRPVESAIDIAQRREAEKRLLDEIVPWHVAAYEQDPTGDTYFARYVGNHFPDLERLQALYTFATMVTELESTDSYVIPNKSYGPRPLSALPSLIATFVQNQKEHAQERLAWEKSCESTLSACRDIYAMLNVTLTDADIRGESWYQDKLQRVVDGLLSSGIAVIDNGAVCVFLPGFVDPNGKPVPVIIKKSDGGFGYATTDLAAIRHRVQELRAERIIYVVDARQRDHFRMVFEVARLADWDTTPDGHRAELKHVPFGAVLGDDKKPLKTRSGENVTLKALLTEAIERGVAEVEKRAADPKAQTFGLPQDELRAIGKAVGIGAVKYADLANDLVRDYVFNFDRMIAFEGNTGPYLQYAHARVCSIFTKGGLTAREAARHGGSSTSGNYLIQQPAERQLALALLRYGSVVADVGRTLEPHRLCTYLYELANLFSTFYQECPVLKAEDDAIRRSRLGLCDLVRRVLASGLNLLGIEAPQRM